MLCPASGISGRWLRYEAIDSGEEGRVSLVLARGGCVVARASGVVAAGWPLLAASEASAPPPLSALLSLSRKLLAGL